MSIKFPPVILEPEMAAPILWAPGIFCFFLLENPHAHKIPPFRGGFWVFLEGGGWKCQFYVYGRGDFSEQGRPILSSAGAGGNCACSVRLPDPSPVLDKNRAPMGPEMLSSTGAGVWRKAPMAFPDSNSVLDEFQSAKKGGFPTGWFRRMFPWNENRNEGTFGCSPGTRTGTRVRSHAAPERRQERGHIRQNHPFAKPPFCLPVKLGNEICARTFWIPPRVWDIPAKFPKRPRFLPSKPKEDKLLREGPNFSTTTPFRGRHPPHPAVSGPKKLISVLFFLAWQMGGQNVSCNLGGGGGGTYRSIQIDYRQTLCLGRINFRLLIQNRSAFPWQRPISGNSSRISHYRYRFSLEFQFISITDTDIGLKKI